MPIEKSLEEIVFRDENDNIIFGIVSVQAYKDGIIVITKDAIYTNVSSFLKK